MAFMKELMRNKHVLNSSEIRIADDDEFVMLVLATLKKCEKAFSTRWNLKTDMTGATDIPYRA